MPHSVIYSPAEACLKQMVCVRVHAHTLSLSLIIQMRAKLEMHFLEYAGFADRSHLSVDWRAPTLSLRFPKPPRDPVQEQWAKYHLFPRAGLWVLIFIFHLTL